LITGGATGICFGIARAFVLHGAQVAIMGRRQQVLDDAVKSLRAISSESSCISVQGDVREPQSAAKVVEAVLKQFGRLDILVVRCFYRRFLRFLRCPIFFALLQNGAAGNFLCSAEDLSVNAFRTVIGIDLVGTFIMSKAAFSALRSAGRAVIINISASTGDLIWYQTHAAAAKAGIDQLTKNLSTEWAPLGIRVVGIAPGAIGDTEGMKRLSGGVEDSRLLDLIPCKRIGRVDDIAQTAVFLAAHDWICGQTLLVDGGPAVWRPPMVSPEVYEQLAASRRSQQPSPQAKL